MQAKDVQGVPAASLRGSQPAAGLRARALDQRLVTLDLSAGAQLPGSVHTPPCDVAGVGGQQHRGAARRVYAVQVKHLLVAQVGGDDEVGGALHHLGQMHDRALCGHQFTQIRIGVIHTPHVNAGVLVAGRVCGDAQPATVGTEAHGTRTDAKRLGIAAVDGAHPDRRHHPVSAEPRDALAVGRHLVAARGLAAGHKVAHRDQLGQLGSRQRRVCGPRGAPCQGQQTEQRKAAPPSPYCSLSTLLLRHSYLPGLLNCGWGDCAKGCLKARQRPMPKPYRDVPKTAGVNDSAGTRTINP
ncbi:hypothetical protein D3C71_1331790 [compost metagenome]